LGVLNAEIIDGWIHTHTQTYFVDLMWGNCLTLTVTGKSSDKNI